MKSLVKLFVMLLLFAILLTACAPQSLMELPQEGRLLILMLVTSALTLFFVWVGGLTGIDFKGYIEPLAVAVSPIVITVIEYYLKMIPSQYDDIATWVIHLLVLLFGGIGGSIVARRIKAKRVKGLLT